MKGRKMATEGMVVGGKLPPASRGMCNFVDVP